ncbi:hypothetical protein AB0O16_04630 [Microbacterium sp. NPDC089180]|uniref:hypothetical protein n=1 Tax=unclassified Microbacterium TaxID=2609290 RepID=UPI003434DA87
MLSDAEREERTRLYARVYAKGATTDQALVNRLRELDDRARMQPETDPAPTEEYARTDDDDTDPAEAGQSTEPGPASSRRRRLALAVERRTAVIPLLAAVAGLVGGAVIGATFTPPRAGGDIPELSYAATSEDRLPFPETVGLLDPASVRFVASTENGLVYVGRQPDVPGEVCLVVVFSSAGDGAGAQCGSADVTAQVDPDTWVVIGEPSTAKMNDILLSRFDTRRLSESVRLYTLRDRS